jgi:hypothetical protein
LDFAVSDGYLVAYGDGGVHIYKRSSNGWQYLKKINGTFGYQMEMSRDVMALESNNAVEIYYRDQGGTENWGWVKSITSPEPNDEVNFPAAIDIWNEYLVISDDLANSSEGRVYLFEKDFNGADNWGKLKTFSISGADNFGTDVSIGSGRLAIGFPLKSSSASFIGQVHIYDQNSGGGNSWGSLKILNKTGATGSYDMFGKSIGIDGDHILVDANLGGPGGGFFHSKDKGGSNNWGQESAINASPFGRDIVDLQGNVAVAGQTGNMIQIFKRDTVSGTWNSSFNGTGSDNTQNGFGERVKVWDHTVVTSNYNKDEFGLSGVGAIYVFEDTAYYNSNPPIIVNTESSIKDEDVIFMNPFQNTLLIKTENALEYSIVDFKGSFIRKGFINSSSKIPSEDWATGPYFVRYKTNDKWRTQTLLKVE